MLKFKVPVKLNKMQYNGLTLWLDNAINFMRILGFLGVVVKHLELCDAVKCTAEIGFPFRSVIGIFFDLTTKHSPCLNKKNIIPFLSATLLETTIQ